MTGAVTAQLPVDSVCLQIDLEEGRRYNIGRMSKDRKIKIKAIFFMILTIRARQRKGCAGAALRAGAESL